MQPTTVSIPATGLLYRVLRAIGVATGDRVRLGPSILLLILLTWVPLAVLALAEGTFWGGVEVPFVRDPAVHARLLVALPLLLLAEAVVSFAARGMIQLVRDRHLIDESEMPALDAAVDRLVRSRDSLVVELLIIAAAVAVIWLARQQLIAERLAAHSSWLGVPGGTPALSLAGRWYFSVSTFVSNVLAFRWIWWLFIWTRFLVGFLRPRFVVSPGHPDQHGGLGFLTVIQGAFAPTFAAVAATLSGRLASAMMYEGWGLKEVKVPAVVVLLLAVLVMFGPLLLFATRLGKAKRQALWHYDALGQQLLGSFEGKWFGGGTGEPILGSPDPSTLADFGTAYTSVKQMKPVPIDIRRAVAPLLFVALPFFPLLLMQMSFKEIVLRVLKLLA